MKPFTSYMKLFSVFSILLFGGILVAANPLENNKQKTFRAGASTAVITPFLGAELIGEWDSPPATYIHDDLYARCLVLDDGATKLVFVVLDLLGIHTNLSEMAKKIIQQNTGIPVENIIISVTHTHTATNAMGKNRRIWNQYPFDEYQDFVIHRIADAVQNANSRLIPAKIGWGVAKAPEHVFVRRWFVKEPVINPFGEYDKVLMNPGVNNGNKTKPTTKPDPDVSFISVQSVKGDPIALFANYSLHYVGGIEMGHVSADYYGMFANRLSELINADKRNPSFVASMSNGTSGNVNNWDFSRPADNLPYYSKAQYVADDIAEKVFNAYRKITYHDWVKLGVKSEIVTLKVRKPDEEMVKRAENILSNSSSKKTLHIREAVYAERTIAQLARPDFIEIPVTSFRIGDLGVTSTAFEVFAETGLEIKAKSPFKQTYVIGIADGYYGYLPTPEQHELGGYETWLSTNNVEKNASVIIVDRMLKQLASLRTKE